ncbi:MAG: hypothetical protein ACTHQ3_07335 [Motilibacteraceae bacterium]
MTDTTPRCPRCSALLAPEAAWCSLCFLDLRPEPAPAASAAAADPALDVDAVTELPVVVGEGTAAAGTTTPAASGSGGSPAPRAGRRFRPGSGAAAAGTAVAEDVPPADADEAPLPPEVDALLAQLAVEEGGGRVSLGPLDDAFSTPGRRAGVMAAGALVVTLTLFLVMWVLGKLLG